MKTVTDFEFPRPRNKFERETKYLLDMTKATVNGIKTMKIDRIMYISLMRLVWIKFLPIGKFSLGPRGMRYSAKAIPSL